MCPISYSSSSMANSNIWSELLLHNIRITSDTYKDALRTKG